MTTKTTYKGRVWTCDDHNEEIEAMIDNGKTKEAKALVLTLNPSKSQGACFACSLLYYETPPCNR
jgi:hypothetical protein